VDGRIGQLNLDQGCPPQRAQETAKRLRLAAFYGSQIKHPRFAEGYLLNAKRFCPMVKLGSPR